ncbi:MAG: helix-turn-helix domain-containing protein [bacterium]
MTKKYKNVSEMIKDLSTEEAYKESVLKEIDGKKIAKFLFVLRCKHELTQKQMAKKIGCTQSRVSKIESSFDNKLSIQDLLDYAKALDLHLEIGYRHPSFKIVDLIKYHALKIKVYLTQLTVLAKEGEDPKLEEGIAKFHIEALVNLNRFISESFSKLDIFKKKRIREKTHIHISAPIDRFEDIEKHQNMINK